MVQTELLNREGIDPSLTRAELTTELMVRRAESSRESSRRRALEHLIFLVNLEVAESVARRYRSSGQAMDDLTQVAAMGLVKAVRRYDPELADDFLTYAVPTMTGELKRHLRDHAWTVRPPRQIQDLQGHIFRVSAEVAQHLGRSPTTGDLAARLGVQAAQITEALAADGCFQPTSISDFDQRAETLSLADMLGIEERGYIDVETRMLLGWLWKSLATRERRILERRYFEEWTQSEIAAELGVSQMQVSRLLSQILGRLRRHIERSLGGHGLKRRADEESRRDQHGASVARPVLQVEP